MGNNIDFRAKIKDIRARMLSGMDIDLAEKEAQPYIDEMNKKGKEIARKYGMRHKNFTFGYLMR